MLGKRIRQQRMGAGKSGNTHLPFVGFRVVLHGAGPKRVGAGVHPEVPGGKPGVMAHHIHFAQVGEIRTVSGQFRRQGTGIDIPCGHGKTGAAFAPSFPQQPFIED